MLVLLVLLSVFDNVKARVVHFVIKQIRAFVLRTHNLRFLEKMLVIYSDSVGKKK